MKQFVLKTPTVLLILLVLSPLLIGKFMLGGLFPNLLNKTTDSIFRIIQIITIIVWYFSILDFFCSDKEDDTNKILIQIMMVIIFASSLGVIFSEGTAALLISVFIGIPLIYLMTKKTKSVFYDRSTWFIALELILVPVGIFTLTEEIKNWEREDLLEENK